MFQQWQAAKSQVPDAILLFRMGDFYEMFGEDAEVASQVLDLTLTARVCGGGAKIPMCGIPYHAVDRYLPRLLEAGLRAAICEQTSDPKASTKLVDRDITRVITRGTAMEDFLLDGRSSNYLLAIAQDGAPERGYGLAWVDVSTGEFRAAEVPARPDRLVDEIRRLGPTECVLLEPLATELGIQERLVGNHAPAITTLEDIPQFDGAEERLCRHFGTDSLRGFGLHGRSAAIEAAALALRYLAETRLDLAGHIRQISLRHPTDVLILDASTQRNLELVRPLHGDGAQGTLLGVLDRTRTLPGGRLLRRWILEPLRDPADISRRLDAVQHFVEHTLLREDVRDVLGEVRDLERLTGRVTTGAAGPRDLGAVRATLSAVPRLRDLLPGDAPTLLATLRDALDPLEDVLQALQSGLDDDLPATLKDGGAIRAGYSSELDELRDLAGGGKAWIARLEAEERAKTGIQTLKVGFNSVFGYYLEVTHANVERVPDSYIRKQTLRNAERYVTPELKAMEEKILAAEERQVSLETELFQELRRTVADAADRLLRTAAACAAVDVLSCLGEVAVRRDYTRPEVNDGSSIVIRDGRHPIVEDLAAAGGFVPNDTDLSSEGTQIGIVTGPNMAGKSTYLRQVALVVVMAQMGSYVPARQATVGVLDRVFTRVGAHDDLASGQSTFMVEMTETANILHNATEQSLVILDEIGRGTSTFDGLSIAWAVTEHLHDAIGAKTLFATHYHQLNALEEILERVRNYRVLVREEGENMVFLRRIAAGGTDRSYGIQVGRLAGLPREVVERAKIILGSLESQELHPGAQLTPSPPPRPARERGQLSLFEPPPGDPRLPVLDRLEALDPDALTPRQAVDALYDLCAELRDLSRGGD